MLRVRKDLCQGCAFCAHACPQQAIWHPWGLAEIDQSRCNLCRLCLMACPHGAIVEQVPVPKNGLQTIVTTLNQKADNLIGRIKRLRR